MAKPKKKKKTQNQIEFEKQLKRIKQAMYRAEKKGYVFDKSAIIPKKPSKITKKHLSELQKITPKVLREQKAIIKPTGYTINAITGEVTVIPTPNPISRPVLQLPEPEEPEYIPKISIIARIAEELQSIPITYYYGKGRFDDKSMEKNELLSMLYDNEDEAEKKGLLKKYIEQLLHNQGEIFSITANLRMKPSNQETVNGCFTRLAFDLTFGNFTLEENKRINDTVYNAVESLEIP